MFSSGGLLVPPLRDIYLIEQAGGFLPLVTGAILALFVLVLLYIVLVCRMLV